MKLVLSQGGRSPSDSAPISEIDILWMTAGLGCDGDTIAVTAATQPSIEELVLGAGQLNRRKPRGDATISVGNFLKAISPLVS